MTRRSCRTYEQMHGKYSPFVFVTKYFIIAAVADAIASVGTLSNSRPHVVWHSQHFMCLPKIGSGICQNITEMLLKTGISNQIISLIISKFLMTCISVL